MKLKKLSLRSDLVNLSILKWDICKKEKKNATFLVLFHNTFHVNALTWSSDVIPIRIINVPLEFEKMRERKGKC